MPDTTIEISTIMIKPIHSEQRASTSEDSDYYQPFHFPVLVSIAQQDEGDDKIPLNELDPSYSTGTASTVDSGSIYSDTYGRSLIRRPYSRMNTLQSKGGRGLTPRPDPVESLGTFGKWHFLILVYTIILGFVVAFQDTVGLDFLAPRNIAYQCDYFGNGSAVTSVQTRSDLLDSIQLRDEERRLVERCFARDFDIRNGSELLPNFESPTSASNASEVLVVDPNSSKPCRKWAFPQDVHKRTMIEEWELVCDASWLSLFPRGAHLAGLLCGALFWALLADRWGRVPSIALANVLHVGASVAAAFAPSWEYFALAKAGSSFGLGGMLIAFILQLETLVAHMRCWVVAGLFLSWSLGLVALPAAALWLSPNWRYLQLAITAVSIVLLPLLLFFRESPRWLLTSGRHERAEKCITAIASINGKVFSEMDAMHLRQSYLDHDSVFGGAGGEFRHGDSKRRRSMFEPNVRCNTICTFIIMAILGYLLYLGKSPTQTIADPYGYMAHPRDNLFWGYVVWCVTEVTAAIFAMYALRFWSRKWTAIFCYLLLAGVYAATVIVPHYLGDNVWYGAGIAMAGRFVASAILAIVSIYCDEVFPTTVRALGSASKHVFFRFALLAEPLFRDMVPTDELPEAGPIINGTLCLVSILLLIILPETYNKPLPDTAYDVSALRRASEQGQSSTLKRVTAGDVIGATASSSSTSNNNNNNNSNNNNNNHSNINNNNKKILKSKGTTTSTTNGGQCQKKMRRPIFAQTVDTRKPSLLEKGTATTSFMYDNLDFTHTKF